MLAVLVRTSAPAAQPAPPTAVASTSATPRVKRTGHDLARTPMGKLDWPGATAVKTEPQEPAGQLRVDARPRGHMPTPPRCHPGLGFWPANRACAQENVRKLDQSHAAFGRRQFA